MNEPPDARLAALAARRHGVFTFAEALAAGLSKDQVARRVRTGRWVRLHPGVYAIAGAPEDWYRSLMAQVVARPGSVVSHTAAGWLLQMTYVGGVRVTTSLDARQRPLPGADLRRRSDLQRCGITRIRSFPTTDRPTTIVDLAGELQRPRFVRLLDDQLSSKTVALEAVLDRFDIMATRGKKGIAVLRRLLCERAGGLIVAPSELTHLFRERVEPLLPVTPVYEFLPPWRTEGIGRVDVAFPEQRLIAELDGRRWHLRDEQWEADLLRMQEAAAHRWRTVRYSYRQLRYDPLHVARNLTVILNPAR